MKQEDKIAREKYLARVKMMRENNACKPDETKAEQDERISKAKKDVRFLVNTYLKHYATSDCADFQIDFAKHIKKTKDAKVLLRWGRGLAKSVWTNLIIPLWLWINGDINYMVIIGNNEDKAEILLNDLKTEFEENAMLIHDFGEQKLYGSWEEGYFTTRDGFTCIALGMGQDARGLRKKAQRPDYISADDLEDKDTLKNPQRQDEIADWILKSIIPTMDGERRRFVCANNRFAPRMIQTVLEDLRPKWKVDRVDAYDPVTYKPRWHQKYSDTYYYELEQGDNGIGIIAALSEYNNKPHIEGKIFTKKDIVFVKMPRLNHFKIIVGHWDIAYSNKPTADYNAVRVWGLHKQLFWYINGFVKQCKMKDALEWMVYYQKSLPDTVSVNWRFEAQFWNDEVKRTIAEVEEKYKIQLNLVKVNTPKTKKYDRILTLQPYYQNERIRYNEAIQANPSTQTGLYQLYGIEPGYKTHDDAPDSDQQSIEYLGRHTTDVTEDSFDVIQPQRGRRR